VINKKIAPYIFLAPFLLFFSLFLIYPLIYAIILSTTTTKGPAGTSVFVGIGNYQKLFQDAEFYKTFLNVLRLAGGVIFILVPFSLLIALLLTAKITKGRQVFRPVIFVPILTSIVVAGIIFKTIFAEESGLLNYFIGLLGFPPQNWLMNKQLAPVAVLILICWRWLGINVLYFSSGLTTIPEDIYEASLIDGAGIWQRFRSITLPLLKPITLFVIIINLTAVFKIFTEIYMLSPTPLIPVSTTKTVIFYLYQRAFRYFEMGYGASIGIIFTIFVVVIAVIQLKLFGGFVKGGKIK